MKKYVRVNLYIASIIGLLIASLATYVGLSHNAQGEFYNVETGAVDLAYASVIFISWFAVTFIVFMVMGVLGVLLFRLLTKAYKSGK